MTTAPKMPDASVPCNPVFVSEVIGDGADAHREVRVGDWTLTAPGANGTDPLVRDLDIGRRVYPNAKPHKIRERIRALIAEGDPNFRPLEVLPHRGKTSSGGRPASEFMLSEHEAVFLVSQIDTPAARSMTHAMIRVFRAAVRGLLAPQPVALPPEIVAEVATLRAEVADLRGELATGVIGADVAAREIVAPLRRIAYLRGATARQRKSWRSRVERQLRNLLGHSRRGATWARLDRKLLGVAQHRVGEWLDDAIAHARKNPPGQMLLPGTPKPSTERPS